MPAKLLHTLLLDTEQGSITVRDLIRSEWRTDEKGVRTETVINPEGTVTVEHTPTLKTLEAAYWRLRAKEYDPMPGVVAADSITALAASHRHAVILKRTGLDARNIADNMLKLGSEQRDWGTASDNLIMILRQYRSLPMLTLFTAHEKFREDEASREKKLGPAMNAMLLSDILDFTDGSFRLSAIDAPQSIETVRYEAGTRFLRMTHSESYFTKVRKAPNQKIPNLVPNPTLWTVKEILKDFFPNRMVIFGSRGAGKTRFVCTLSDPTVAPNK